MKTLDLFNLPLYWEMVNSEKISLFNLLKEIKPEISIEIGTRKGGSLQLISALSEMVYSLDIDPSVIELRTRFQNVNFIIGDSKNTLPDLLNQLTEKGKQPDFVLVDGNHSSEGVKSDILNVLKLKVIKPLVILLHDSFNPDCRKGMLEIDYEGNSYVEFVDMDFVQGIYSPSQITKGEMWGGFGIIYMKPEVRTGSLMIRQSNVYSFNTMYRLSKHFQSNQQTPMSRIKSYLFRKWFG